MWMSWIVIHFRMFLRTMQWSNHCVRWQVFLVGVFVGLRPLFLCLVCCFFWRNASLAGGFAGRLAGWCFVCLIVICLSRLIWSLYKLYKLTFYRLCSCKDRATVRHRPHSRENKNVTPRHFAWQAWHKLTPTVVSVAGVAQTHTYYRFTWQAWHKLTSTVVLRGRRGTTWHPPSFHVAGVAQTHIHRRFAWQAWHSWHWVWWAHHRFDSRAWWNSKKAEQLTHKQLTHKQLTLHTYIHDIHTYLPTYIHTFIPTYLLDLSPTPLQPLKLIIGRSWLVGLSGPLISLSLFFSLFLYLSLIICLPTYWSICLSIYLSVCLTFSLSIYLAV